MLLLVGPWALNSLAKKKGMKKKQVTTLDKDFKNIREDTNTEEEKQDWGWW